MCKCSVNTHVCQLSTDGCSSSESGTCALQALTAVCLMPSYLFNCLTNVSGAPAMHQAVLCALEIQQQTRQGFLGLPWWSHGWDFTFQGRGVPVPSLVRELGMAHASQPRNKSNSVTNSSKT